MNITHTVRTLWTTFGKYRWHILLLAVLGVLSAALEGIGINAVIPLLSSFTGGISLPTDFISQTIGGLFAHLGIPFTFRYLLGFILVLFLTRAVIMVIFTYVRSWTSADFLYVESSSLLSRTFSASWAFLLKQKMGTLQNTLVRDVQRSADVLSVIGQMLQSFGGFLMYLLVAINISLPTTLYTLGAGAVLVFFIRPFIRKSRIIAERAVAIEKEYSHFLSEHIIGMKSVKASGAEGDAKKTGIDTLGRQRALSLRLAFVRALSGSLFQPFTLVFVVILFLLTSGTPGFSIISFIATLYLIQKIFTYLESGMNALHGFSELVPYVNQLSEFKRASEAYREEREEGTAHLSFDKDLTFDHVSFSYGGESTVLDDVSFTLERGTTIGMIGPSGSGKTTVADLLLRLFSPTEGKILLDGVSIDSIRIQDWRRYVGYVSQDVFLLNASVKENIRFYADDVSDEEIEEVAKLANCYDFIMELPQGFDTAVGDRGVLLSGGQRQRIVLARALARKPKLLILDEATSALDSESERLIHGAIQNLHGKVTVFIIAHRLSTIESVDRLLVLTAGKLIEEGTPEELRTNPDSYFARAIKTAGTQGF